MVTGILQPWKHVQQVAIEGIFPSDPGDHLHPGFHTVTLDEASQAKIPSMLFVMTRSNVVIPII